MFENKVICIRTSYEDSDYTIEIYKKNEEICGIILSC